MLIIKTVSVELERRTDQEIYLLEHSWGLYFKDKQASTSISLDLGLSLQPENGPVNSGLSLDRIPSSFKIKGGWFRYFAPVMIVSWHTEYSRKLLLRETMAKCASSVTVVEGRVPMQTPLFTTVVSKAKSWMRMWEGTHYFQTLKCVAWNLGDRMKKQEAIRPGPVLTPASHQMTKKWLLQNTGTWSSKVL